MASEREIFEVSGPLHLTSVDWKNADHRRSVAACLVQGVYIMELDRNHTRLENEALAPPWWKSFHFELCTELIDDADSSIFGAIYELKSSSSSSSPSPSPSPSDITINKETPPRYVIAFRGTLVKGDAFSRDFQLDVHFIRNKLHSTTRFEIAEQAVRSMVSTYGSSNIWLTGHSLGSALAMLVAKKLARNNVLLESFLFNPPYFAAPIERIKDRKVKHGIRFASSVITAGLAFASKNNKNESGDTFETLSEWIPSLHVNPSDHICCEYIGYFEHRKKMEDMGVGMIEKLATKHSLGNLVMNAMSKDSLIEEPLHLIPSANLIVNLSPAKNFKDAHGIHQWWRSDIVIDFRTYKY